MVAGWKHTTVTEKFRQAGSLPKYHCSSSSWALEMLLTCQAISAGCCSIIDSWQGSRRPLILQIWCGRHCSGCTRRLMNVAMKSVATRFSEFIICFSRLQMALISWFDCLGLEPQFSHAAGGALVKADRLMWPLAGSTFFT